MEGNLEICCISDVKASSVITTSITYYVSTKVFQYTIKFK